MLLTTRHRCDISSQAVLSRRGDEPRVPTKSYSHCKKSWVFFALKNWVFFTPKNWAKFLGILVWTPKHGISEITKANYIWYMLKLPNSLNVGKVIFTRIYTRWSSQIYLSRLVKVICTITQFHQRKFLKVYSNKLVLETCNIPEVINMGNV